MELVGVMKLILILSYPFKIQERESYLYDFFKKILTLACTFTDQFLSNLVGERDY